MSLNVTLNGSVYIIPETGEVGWGGNTTSYLVAIAAGVLQKTGGSFTLSAETDFGASFGIKSLYYKSRSANIADAGILRLNNNSDSINWRNAANGGNLSLLANASDQLSYNGAIVLTGASPSSYVSSITGTANQVIASASTGAVTLSLPQSINTNATIQFGTLGLGSALVSSSILSLTSTTLGFLPPRLTTVERDAIAAPATGLFIYNTTTGANNYYNGASWLAIAAGGTINAGLQNQLAYYTVNGTTLSGLTLITGNRALQSDSSGLPIASSVTDIELGYVSGVTSAIQTQLNLKAPLASPTFTGTVTIPTPFTLGVVSVTATGVELNYSVGVTSSIQTQLNAKVDDGPITTSGLTQSTARLLGRTTAGTGAIEEIAVGASLSLSAGTLNTIQAITTASSPTFAGLSLTGDQTITKADDTRLSLIDTGDSSTVLVRSDGANSQIGTSSNHNFALIANGIEGVILNSTTGSSVAIRGTNTNNDAASGFVGEYIESVNTATTNSTGTTQWTDVASISLTAGDWDVSGTWFIESNGATWILASSGISTTAGNSATGLVLGNNRLQDEFASTSTTITSVSQSIPVYRITLTGTTTVYHKFRADFSAGTPRARGRISARRVR